MADYANYKFFTEPDASHEADPVIGPLLQKLREKGYHTFHILHKWLHVAPADAEAEIRTDFTTLFDGVATPILLAIDSSDNTQDKAAGTGAKTASMLKTLSTHLMAEESYTLVGTTVVDGADLNEHLNDMKILTYGSDGQPTGTIQAINHADSAVYAKIADTGHCTINARTYIPAGYAGYLVLNAKVKYNGIVSAAAGITATEGVRVRWKFVTLDANEPIDQALIAFTIGVGDGLVDITPPKVVRAGATDEYVTILVDVGDEDANGLVWLDYQILMWA